MKSEDLLQEIQKAGLADEGAVNKLRRESLLSGQSLDAAASRTRLVDGAKLAELKGRLLKVPYKKIDADSFDASLLEIIPEETARTYQVVPISKQDNMLVLGMVNPDDSKAQDALKFVARRNRLNLGVYIISHDDWQEIIKKYSSYRTEIERALEAFGIKPGVHGRRAIALEGGGAAEEAPIIRIVADTLQEAVSSRASDVHIEPQENYLRIRFRIDGDLKEAASLPVEVSQPVVSRV